MKFRLPNHPDQKLIRLLQEMLFLDFGIRQARIKLISSSENLIFRITAIQTKVKFEQISPYADNIFSLRVHRPGYQTYHSINSELAWLAAIRQDTNIIVPQPIKTIHGKPFSYVSIKPKNLIYCSLLRWIPGRSFHNKPQPHHYEMLGKIIAQIHNHSANWAIPKNFQRRDLDLVGLFGNNAGWGIPAKHVWASIPPYNRNLFRSIITQFQEAMADLGKNIDAFGLIHGDMHLGNVLFSKGKAQVIDFDDCGRGYWLFDLATALCGWPGIEHDERIRNSLLKGYTTIRSLPQKQLAHLDLFIAARRISLALWAVALELSSQRSFNGSLKWINWASIFIKKFIL